MKWEKAARMGWDKRTIDASAGVAFCCRHGLPWGGDRGGARGAVMSRVTRAQATRASRIRGRGVSRWPLTREVLTCCVGYGAFLAYYPPGPVGAAWCLAFGGQSLSVSLARGVFFLTLILTLLVIAVGRRGACVCTRADAALSFATAAAGFVSLDLLSAWGMGDAGLFCCCALIGAAGAYPLLCSYDALLRIRQAGSAATGFAVLAGASREATPGGWRPCWASRLCHGHALTRRPAVMPRRPRWVRRCRATCAPRARAARVVTVRMPTGRPHASWSPT